MSQRIHYLTSGPDRWKERSRTFVGISKTMADQWNEKILVQATIN